MVTEISASLRTFLLGLRSSPVKRRPVRIRIPPLPLMVARSFPLPVSEQESCFWATQPTT